MAVTFKESINREKLGADFLKENYYITETSKHHSYTYLYKCMLKMAWQIIKLESRFSQSILLRK